MRHDNATLANDMVKRCLALGATEASVSVSSSTHVHITRRDGQIEQATEATNRGLSVAVLVGDRFSSSSTSDLRPETLETFASRCVEAAAYWKPILPGDCRTRLSAAAVRPKNSWTVTRRGGRATRHTDSRP